MNPRSLLAVAFVSLVACAEKGGASSGNGGPSEPKNAWTSSGPATIAHEGEICGDGQAGRPNAVCEQGFVCAMVLTSKEPGKCRKNIN